MQIKFIIAVPLALLLNFPLGAEEQQLTESLEAEQILKRDTGNDWLVYRDKGIIRRLETADQNNSANSEKNYLSVYKRPMTATPEQTALQFLHDYHALLQIPEDLSTLQVPAAEDFGVGSYGVIAQQIYQGVPIFEHGIVVVMNRNTGIFMVDNSYYYEKIAIDTIPRLSIADITAIAQEEYAKERYLNNFYDPSKKSKWPKHPRITYKLGLKVYGNSQPVLEYIVTLDTLKSYDIDANSGEILSQTTFRRD